MAHNCGADVAVRLEVLVEKSLLNIYFGRSFVITSKYQAVILTCYDKMVR